MNEETKPTEAEFMAEIEKGQRELSAMRKDAERYRFLRDNPYFQIEYTGELTLDEHVDAEMQREIK